MKTITVTHKHIPEFAPVVMLLASWEALDVSIKENYDATPSD